MADNRKKLLAPAAAVVLLLGVVIFALLRPSETTVTTFAMGSYVRQSFTGGGKETAVLAGSAVTRLENRISWRVEGSDICRLNEGEAISPEEDFLALLKLALAVSEKSGGAFDPTILPVSSLWDFDGDPHLPEGAELQAALQRVDYHSLSIENNAVRLENGAALDLGALGKGAACDAILACWQENSVIRGVAAVGGSVGLYGKKPMGKSWSVAVRDPRGEGSLGVLSLPGGCVSTSGSYEKTFRENGVAYHHLLDPETGCPAESGLVSVTVWRSENDGADGALTDALSTACFVLGMEKSLPLLEEFHAQALFITEEGKLWATEGLSGAFSLTAEGYTWEGSL